MSADRQSRIHELFAAAIDEEPCDRRALLERECAGDTELLNEVCSLLAHHDAADGFIDTPVIEKALLPTRGGKSGNRAAETERAAAPQMPERIGEYQIIRRLGEGGMGVVYLAEQSHPRRTVAIKVIKSGAMSPTLLRRFEHEAQVLGRLQHPGIAQIFQAGAAEINGHPQPFFALEYIEGKPLSKYAHDNRLGVRARLELFVRICDAVHHAHQKGVIHRDLKPGNILVDGRGQPKILDFGVARVTDADLQMTTIQTDIGQIIGTIPYMSPEQIAGRSDELDTRSDVYALGVLCYELLTGRLPHDLNRKIITEAARIIREDDPTPISSVNRALRGDIETIVLKALDKDRDRRYPSASELAADVRRYLNDEPIIARPASRLYQMQKFARRHRTLVGATAALIVVLAAGLVYSNVQRRRAESAQMKAEAAEKARGIERDRAVEAEQLARDEAARAHQEARKAERIADFLQSTLANASPFEASDRDLTVAEFAEASIANAGRELKDEPVVLASVRTTIGRMLSGLARYDEADEQLELALAYQLPALGESHPDTIISLQSRGTLRKLQGNQAAALEDLTRAAALAETTFGEGDARTAQIINDLGAVKLRMRQFDGALSDFERAHRIARETLGEDDALSAELLANKGYALIYLERPEEARGALQQALEVMQRIDQGRNLAVAAILNNLSYVRRILGDSAGCQDALREALSIDEEIFGRDHPRTIRSLNNLAVMLRRGGNVEEAEAMYREVVARRKRVLGADHPDVARSLTNLGFLLTYTGRYEEARDVLAEAVGIHRDAKSEDRIDLANTLTKLGDALFKLDELENARAAYAEARAIYDDAPEADRRAVAATASKLGRCLIALGRGDEGEPLLREGVERLLADGQTDGEVGRGLKALIAYYEWRGDSERATHYKSIVASHKDDAP